MNLIALTMTALMMTSPGGPPTNDDVRLAELSRAVLKADYRGDRGELRRLAAALDDVKDEKLSARRDYWKGFAFWRRALNGFNETPASTDLRDDLKSAVASFRSSLAREPGWIEAEIGMVGCLGSELFLGITDPEERMAILKEVVPLVKDMKEKGADNPRALWLVGGMQLWPPPGKPSDPAGAAATYRRGIEAAEREGLHASESPAWEPAWGAPEHLMSLAYVYSHSAIQNRAVAEAYADGTLAAVPDWHYVRDILVPQIEALPAAQK